jgi:MSHA pilin protein MshD
VTKQSMVVAESLLNEILHHPFSWCDPDDPAIATAQSYDECDLPQNILGPVPASEVRGSNAPSAGFDHVADYAGYTMNDVGDAAGDNPMTGFTASVAMEYAGGLLGLTDTMGLTDNSAALRITVTVTRNGEAYSLTGYRIRYAPRI